MSHCACSYILECVKIEKQHDFSDNIHILAIHASTLHTLMYTLGLVYASLKERTPRKTNMTYSGRRCTDDDEDVFDL